MNDCERYEVAIEQRRLGELPAPEADALDAHLATCASCQAFARFSQRTEAAMTRNDATLDEIDYTAIKRRLLRIDEHARDVMLVSLAGWMAAIPLILHAIGGLEPEPLVLMMIMTPLAFWVRSRISRPLFEQMKWTASRGEDFFQKYRALLLRQERMLRRGIYFLPAWALFLEIVGYRNIGRGDLTTVLCRVLFLIVVGLYVAWLDRVALRRVRRVLEQLP